MHVLVTGGAGFIGSHLVDALLERGDTVTVLDDLSTGDRGNVPDAAQLIEASILDGDVVDRAVRDANAVYHLAAVVGVQRYVRDPGQVIHTNVQGTEHVVRSCEAHGVPMLLTSTSEAYGNTERMPMSESDPVQYGPTTNWRWCYGMAKALDEMLVLEATHRGRLDGRVVRLFNTVGPRQSGAYGMVVARFVEQALRGGPLTVYGDGQQTRTFCDVSDTVRALQLVMETPELCGEVVNIGGSEEWRMSDLAWMVIRQIGETWTETVMVPYDEAMGEGFEDIRRRRPDTRKITATTGWRPEVSLAETIERIAAARKVAV